MPIRVTLIVKRGPSIPVHEQKSIAKKQRTTPIPSIPMKREDVNAVEEVNIKTEAIDGSKACDNRSGSALYEPSYDPHPTHQTSISASKQVTTKIRAADHTDACSFNLSIDNDSDSLSNQMDNGFSELPCEEDFEDTIDLQVGPSSAAQGPAAIPSVLNKKQKRKCRSWDERFQEVVDFKKINGHPNVPVRSGSLGMWINTQRKQYRLLKEGKRSSLTNDRREKLESIGFVFKCQPPRIPWDERFQKLVDFKKINGHPNVPKGSGPLGHWLKQQRAEYRLFREGKHSTLTIERRDKLQSIGLRVDYV